MTSALLMFNGPNECHIAILILLVKRIFRHQHLKIINDGKVQMLFLHEQNLGTVFRCCSLGFLHEQDLGKVLRCYSLGSSLKILLCGFFLIDRSVFFKLSSHMAEF